MTNPGSGDPAPTVQQPTIQQPTVGPTFQPANSVPPGIQAPKKRNGLLIAILAIVSIMGLMAVLAIGGGFVLFNKAKGTIHQKSQQVDGANKDLNQFLSQLTTTTEDANMAAPTADKLFPGRIDSQAKDQERNIGQSVQFSGYTTTVNSASFAKEVNGLDTGWLVVDVTIVNRDKSGQEYNKSFFKAQTPNGEVLDPSYLSINGELSDGQLVNGGNVTGKVYFEVNDRKDDFYVIFKPDTFDTTRGIWKVNI